MKGAWHPTLADDAQGPRHRRSGDSVLGHQCRHAQSGGQPVPSPALPLRHPCNSHRLGRRHVSPLRHFLLLPIRHSSLGHCRAEFSADKSAPRAHTSSSTRHPVAPNCRLVVSRRRRRRQQDGVPRPARSIWLKRGLHATLLPPIKEGTAPDSSCRATSRYSAHLTSSPPGDRLPLRAYHMVSFGSALSSRRPCYPTPVHGEARLLLTVYYV